MAPPQKPFSLGERLGIFLTVEASVLSAASVTFILCYTLYRWLRSILCTGPRSRPSDATSSVLFLNLMLADLVQAFGNMPSLKWMISGAVLPSTLCTTQAVLKQIGIVGVAMTSLAIALHTFSILVLHWQGPKHFPKYAVIAVWAFAAIVIGIANAVHRKEVYYGDTGYWCWITDKFRAERIVTEYLWVWVTGLFMIILYGIMFATIRRWFTIAQGVRWYNQPLRSPLDPESDHDKRLKAVANSMLYYPAVYMFCVFPNTVARWLSFSDPEPPPYQFTLFASTIYGLSGVFNLILFFLTRPKLVVGRSTSAVPKDVTSSFHSRGQDLARSSFYQGGKSPSSDYGVPSIDFNRGPPRSSFELKSPSRTMNRPRSFYQDIPLSPTRQLHFREVPSDVLDIS